MSVRPAVFDSHEDLQTRVMQALGRAIEDASVELCMREGSVPAGAARMVFYEVVLVSMISTIMALTGVESGSKRAAQLIQEAARGLASGRAVPLDRPKEGA